MELIQDILTGNALSWQKETFCPSVPQSVCVQLYLLPMLRVAKSFVAGSVKVPILKYACVPFQPFLPPVNVFLVLLCSRSSLYPLCPLSKLAEIGVMGAASSVCNTVGAFETALDLLRR